MMGWPCTSGDRELKALGVMIVGGFLNHGRSADPTDKQVYFLLDRVAEVVGFIWVDP